jgi:hypothetical protein
LSSKHTTGSLILLHRAERFEFRFADFAKLEIQQSATGSRLRISEYSVNRIPYRNFCLLGIIFEVKSVESSMTRRAFAHHATRSNQGT